MFFSRNHHHRRSHCWRLLIMACILSNVNAQSHRDPSPMTDENEIVAKLECGDRSVAVVTDCFILCHGFPPKTASLPVNSTCTNLFGKEGVCEPFENHTICVSKDENFPMDIINAD